MSLRLHHSDIQALLFPIDKFDVGSVQQYLNKHKFHKLKPERYTEHFIRVRLQNPDDFRHFITKTLNDGVKIIIGYY